MNFDEIDDLDDAIIEIDDLDDAIIEDTCHCDLCGTSFVLGSCPDYVIVDLAGPGQPHGVLGGQLKLCDHCAQRVSEAHRDNLRRAGVCEHGLPDTEFCGPCNKEYKRARRENGLDDEKPIPVSWQTSKEREEPEATGVQPTDRRGPEGKSPSHLS